MAHLAGSDRSQLLLLPETVDDYVGPDSPVRFIKAFVDQCNQVLDMGLLAPTVEAAIATPDVDRIEAVADKGYFKIDDVEACEKAGVTVCKSFAPRTVLGG